METDLFFDAEKYWATREYKKWVVFVYKVSGYGKMGKGEKLYVRARTQGAAVRTAMANSCLGGRRSASARLANPWDLGIV